MTKDKFYKFSLIALFLLNVGLICFLIFNKPPHHKGRKNHGRHHMPPPPKQDGPKSEIISILDFDEAQIKEYDALIENHRESVETVENNIKESKEKLYASLNTNDSVVEIDALKSLAQYQSEIEKLHLNHFKDIKVICKDEQLKNYSKLTEKLARFFSKDRKPKKH